MDDQGRLDLFPDDRTSIMATMRSLLVCRITRVRRSDRYVALGASLNTGVRRWVRRVLAARQS